MNKPRHGLAGVLIAFCLAIAANAQTVSQVVNTVAVGGITGLGTGVATLLAGTSSGTVGLVGTTSPTLITPVLGAATATSINFGQTTLNNYTAGSWTPTLIGSATPGTGQTYSSQIGSYEQIGRQVTVRFTVAATSLGTAAGNMLMGGLPIAPSTENGYCIVSLYSVTGLAALNYGVTGYIAAAASTINLISNSSTAFTTITVAQSGATATFDGFCTYRAS